MSRFFPIVTSVLVALLLLGILFWSPKEDPATDQEALRKEADAVIEAGVEEEPVATTDPDRIVVLTFDDSVKSHATFVGPLLQEYDFGATFFITEGFKFVADKEHYMTWDEIKGLHEAGFEIGNHTRRHRGVGGQSEKDLLADVVHIEERCAEHGIPRPTSFCYPGYQTSERAVKILRERGYQFARAGGKRAYDTTGDEPLLMPQAFDGKPECTLEQFQEAVALAGAGKVVVLTFHGVPDIKHPWVNTTPEAFTAYLEHLKAENCTVVSLRELGDLLTR